MSEKTLTKKERIKQTTKQLEDSKPYFFALQSILTKLQQETNTILSDLDNPEKNTLELNYLFDTLNNQTDYLQNTNNTQQKTLEKQANTNNLEEIAEKTTKHITKKLEDTQAQFLTLQETIDDIRTETYYLLDEANTHYEKTREIINLINAIKATSEYLQKVNIKELKILRDGKENGTNNLIHLYQAINETYTVMKHSQQKELNIKQDLESIIGEKIYANELNLKRAVMNIFQYFEEKANEGTITLGAEKLENKIKIYIDAEKQKINEDELKKIGIETEEIATNQTYAKLITAKNLTNKLNGELEIKNQNENTTISIYLDRIKK